MFPYKECMLADLAIFEKKKNNVNYKSRTAEVLAESRNLICEKYKKLTKDS